jgi:hypothetical protein
MSSADAIEPDYTAGVTPSLYVGATSISPLDSAPFSVSLCTPHFRHRKRSASLTNQVHNLELRTTYSVHVCLRLVGSDACSSIFLPLRHLPRDGHADTI